MTLLHLTEGLWECETTILGHCFDYCTSFIWRNANQPPPHPKCEEKSGSCRLYPHVYPLHKFCLVVVFYNKIKKKNVSIEGALSAIILNISLFWQHYHNQLITIFLFFSLFSKRWKSPKRRKSSHLKHWGQIHWLVRFNICCQST